MELAEVLAALRRAAALRFRLKLPNARLGAVDVHLQPKLELFDVQLLLQRELLEGEELLLRARFLRGSRKLRVGELRAERDDDDFGAQRGVRRRLFCRPRCRALPLQLVKLLLQTLGALEALRLARLHVILRVAELLQHPCAFRRVEERIDAVVERGDRVEVRRAPLRVVES